MSIARWAGAEGPPLRLCRIVLSSRSPRAAGRIQAADLFTAGVYPRVRLRQLLSDRRGRWPSKGFGGSGPEGSDLGRRCWGPRPMGDDATGGYLGRSSSDVHVARKFQCRWSTSKTWAVLLAPLRVSTRSGGICHVFLWPPWLPTDSGSRSVAYANLAGIVIVQRETLRYTRFRAPSDPRIDNVRAADANRLWPLRGWLDRQEAGSSGPLLTARYSNAAMTAPTIGPTR